MSADIYLVEGCPGGGKTRYLSQQCERAVETHGPAAVAIASLTRTAAAEIAGRVNLPDGAVGTMHAHAYRGLDRPELAETPEGIASWNGAHPSLALGSSGRSALEDAPVESDDAGRTHTEQLHAQVMNHRARLTPREQWTPAEQDYAALWDDWKRQTHRLDFTDLIEQAIEDLPAHPAIPKVLLLDESQDFSALELRLAMQWAKHTDTTVIVGDLAQCQPAGTMVCTTSGDVPIEHLDPATHRLVTFDRRGGTLLGLRDGYTFKIAKREYHGDLLEVTAASRSTRCTPEHRWVAKWTATEGAFITYLMRRGHRWRVGWCQLHSPARGFHLGTRARIERADQAWILGVYRSRTDASIAESVTAAEFGLPTITFEPVNGARHLTETAIDTVFNALNPHVQKQRAWRCLYEHGRDMRYPIYDAAAPQTRRGVRSSLTVRACNLIPGLMSIPVPVSGRAVTWEPVTSVIGLRVTEPVWSIEVAPHNTYIADGLVTHNSIYGFRGAEPEAFANLPITGRRALDQSYRVPRRIANLAHAWLTEHAPRGLTDWQSTADDGHVRALPVALRNPGSLIEPIQEDLDAGRTVMVLAACGYMLGPIVHELRDAGLPFHNPYRATHGGWNPMRGARRLAAFLRHDDRVWGEQARIWTWNDLRIWTEPLQAKDTLTRGAKALIEAKCRRDEFGRTQADQEVPLDTLQDLLGVADTRHHPAFRGNVDWWADQLRASQAKQNAYPVEVYKRQGPGALLAEPRIVVGTGHSVKGGEASSVYICPGLSKQGYWHGWFPGGPTRHQVARLFYVMATRAREKLTILAPSEPENVHGTLLEAMGDMAVAA